MNLRNRIEKLEQEERKNRVRYVIRSRQDRDDLMDSLAREKGFEDMFDFILQQASDIPVLLKQLEDLERAGELEYTTSYYEELEEERKSVARRQIEYVYLSWQRAIDHRCPEEGRKQAYSAAHRRGVDCIWSVLKDYREAIVHAWNTMWQGQEMEAWLQEVETNYPPSVRAEWTDWKKGS